MHDNPDSETLARLWLNAPADSREALARAFGAADLAARHAPAYAIPDALRAVLLATMAAEARARRLPGSDALANAAAVMLDQAAAPLFGVVGLDIPDTPEGL